MESLVYVVDDNPGRSGSYRSRISLWKGTLEPVLLMLISYHGHDSREGSPVPPGLQRYRNPMSPRFFIDLDPAWVQSLREQLQTDGYLDRIGIADGAERANLLLLADDEVVSLENDEDEGYCEVTAQEVRDG